VRKYYYTASVDDILAKARDGRGSVLEPFKPYLHDRVNVGIANGSRLFREIQAQGYTGSKTTVLAYLRPLRAAGAAPAGRTAGSEGPPGHPLDPDPSH
jgi:transposase